MLIVADQVAQNSILTGEAIRLWAPTCAYFIGMVAALLSWYQYAKNSRRERSRWLFDLYQRFYGDPSLKKMASLIDWGETSFLRDESERQLWTELDEYLNFFEFIAFLKRNGQLKLGEIRSMFDYPLEKISDDPKVLAYLRLPEHGYEGLNELLKDLGYPA